MTQRIPTSIISGFLGVGKTTAIINLLAQQQARGERWAVLVNEFGEVGIDGAVLQGSDDQLTVQEIPGGCICCTVGMHFQVALPRLIRTVRPDRLLIEPTGVGHPSGILNTLRNEFLSQALQVNATICLADPQQFSQDLLENSPVYYDQLYLADIVALNKCDVAEAEKIAEMREFLATLPPKQAIVETTQGQLDPAWLDLPLQTERLPSYLANQQTHDHDHEPKAPNVEVLSQLQSTSDVQRFESKGEGRHACGWIFPPHTQFSEAALTALFARLSKDGADIERAKGIFQLSDGDWLLFNRAGGRLEMQAVKQSKDSRVEFIAATGNLPDWNALETALLAAQNPHE